MSHVTHWKAYRAKGAIPEFHIVKPDTSDDEVKLASAATDKVLAVTGRGDVADGARVDVAMQGEAAVMYGAAVTRGDRLKASGVNNKHGRAIPTTTAGDHIVGVALVSGVDGDIGLMRVGPGNY